jgi:hypothetical protein
MQVFETIFAKEEEIIQLRHMKRYLLIVFGVNGSFVRYADAD